MLSSRLAMFNDSKALQMHNETKLIIRQNGCRTLGDETDILPRGAGSVAIMRGE